MRPLTPREKLLAFAAALILAVVALYRWGMAPVSQEWDAVNAELQSLQQRYQKFQALAQSMQSRSPLPAAALAAPSGKTSMADFIRDIETAAGREIYIKRFNPLKNVTVNARGDRGKVLSQQIQIECSGTLQALAAFFDRLERENYIFIRHLTLTPDRNEPAQIHCQVVLARVTMT